VAHCRHVFTTCIEFKVLFLVLKSQLDSAPPKYLCDYICFLSPPSVVKRVKRHDCMLYSWHRLLHTSQVNGMVWRCLYWCHFLIVAPICSSVLLPFIYLNLSAILIPSGRFSCKSQVSYHIIVYYCITRIRATRLAKRKPPSRFRQVLSLASRRTRHSISMTLVPNYSNQAWICHGCCFVSCKGVLLLRPTP